MVLETIREIEIQYNVRVVYVTLSGSKLYGTDTPNSDTDYKGIFVPSKEDVLLKKDLEHISISKGNGQNTKNGAGDVDADLYSVYKFFNLIQKSETGSVDVLFSMWSKPRKSKELVEIEDNYSVDEIKKIITKGDDIKDLLKKLKYK